MALFVPGPTGGALARRLADQTKGTLGQVEFKDFPDGEHYVRIVTPVRGQDVIIVQTGYPASTVVPTLLLLAAARENGAREVRLVAPYLPYARQDRRFLEGEPTSAQVLARAFKQYASHVVSVDLHKDDVRKFFDGACTNVSSAPAFAQALKARGVDVVLAPDAGARARAEEVALLVGAKLDHLEKKRISSEVVEMKPKSLDVRGKRVAILDDIISTGGTMATAAGQLVKAGASEVLCAGVHGLFIGDCLSKLKNAGVKDVLVADTIETPQSVVSVASLIADALRPTLRA